uniref:Uncharacterized protein n=1 Tax=Chromulina nebulosa TaxID=96789 RepID=A0A7S0SY04_9STRA
MMTLNEYKEELKNTYNDIGFSIGSSLYSTNEDKIINKINTHKDFYDNIKYHMNSSDSLYVGYILLSDRFDFNGGSIYVDKLKQSTQSILEDVYDDDISPDTVHGHQLHLIELKKYSVQGKLYDEYTPEKGEMLVIDNRVKHYLSPINKGKQDYLLIEFDLLNNCQTY